MAFSSLVCASAPKATRAQSIPMSSIPSSRSRFCIFAPPCPRSERIRIAVERRRRFPCFALVRNRYIPDATYSQQPTPRHAVRTEGAVAKNGGILLVNLLQSSRSTFSCEGFLSFFAFNEGMLDTQISALGD